MYYLLPRPAQERLGRVGGKTSYEVGTELPVIETPKSQYAQIAEELRGRIESGGYPPGSPLPSESRLAEELGVSRVTINKALTLLRASGDVKVRRGSGT